MAKVLLIGYDPPIICPNNKIEAANYRTWQFLYPLLVDSNVVCFCAISNSKEKVDLDKFPPKWREQFVYYELNVGRIGWIRQLQSIYKNFSPDCIVAVNFDSSLNATKLITDKPIWMDIYGDYLTIIQAANYRKHSDRGLMSSIRFVKETLKKGDVISVCSQTQRHIAVGELAMAGRLNAQSFGYDFVDVVLPGVLKEEKHELEIQKDFRKILNIDDNDFVVLWCGGYNTWTDIDTLFESLELAMKANDRIHFLSVGANTYQAPDNVYERFLGRIKNSGYQSRFHMLGWQPWGKINALYHAADIGINIDAMHYETIYGTRTRLLEMIGAGLPIMTSLGSELSFFLKEKNSALIFDIGDKNQLAEHLIVSATNPELLQVISINAANLAEKELSFSCTTQRFREWVKSPQLAPDHQQQNSNFRKDFENYARTFVRRVLWVLFGLSK